MAVISKDIGATVCQAGQTLKELYVIGAGSISAQFSGGEITLGKGDIIGIQDILTGFHSCTYTVLKPVTLLPYPYESADKLFQLLESKPDVAHLFFTAQIRTACAAIRYCMQLYTQCQEAYESLTGSYQEYRSICTQNSISPQQLPDMDTLEPYSSEDMIPDWLLPYYEAFQALDKNVKSAFYQHPSLLTGFLLQACENIGRAFICCTDISEYLQENMKFLLSENHMDLTDLYSNLYFKLTGRKQDTTLIRTKLSNIFDALGKAPWIDRPLYQNRLEEYNKLIVSRDTTDSTATEDRSALSELDHALDTILEYGKCDEALCLHFHEVLDDFRALVDKNDTGDEARRIRNNLSKDYYEIYKEVLLESLHSRRPAPIPVKLFLNFGFVDTEIAGAENASYLLSIAERFHGDSRKGIYTLPEWFQAIYNGDKEPSRNEFDMDYAAALHEQRTSGKISAADESRMLHSSSDKVLFELENVFPQVNKMTFGRVSTFCPILSEHNILKSLSDALVTPQRISDALRNIRNVDFCAYYRETVYTNDACGISREFVQTEILPDFILMPNVGTRGAMWQEIEGKRRTTPARMMLSAFLLENLDLILTRLTGEFRWEMCKRIQGARWNDISEMSLTSEYCDYAQFFKKNNDLSPDAKEKIKTSLQKAKNSFKELFVMDYITWITYEGKGAPHLNKVVRNIMFNYCPFSGKLRDELKTHPLYKDIIERYGLRTKQKLHHYDMLCGKLKKQGFPIPDEIQDQMDFLTL